VTNCRGSDALPAFFRRAFAAELRAWPRSSPVAELDLNPVLALSDRLRRRQRARPRAAPEARDSNQDLIPTAQATDAASAVNYAAEIGAGPDSL